MSNNPYEKKDRNEAVKEMKRQGYTFRETSETFGISFQRVATICGGMTLEKEKYFQRRAIDKCVYPNLKNYLIENRVSIAELSRRMFGNSHPGNCERIRHILYHESRMNKPTIDKLLKATGLTYEVAFAEEV